jgi:hypothetical protein
VEEYGVSSHNRLGTTIDPVTPRQKQVNSARWAQILSKERRWYGEMGMRAGGCGAHARHQRAGRSGVPTPPPAGPPRAFPQETAAAALRMRNASIRSGRS